jgi:hypothetical protein
MRHGKTACQGRREMAFQFDIYLWNISFETKLRQDGYKTLADAAALKAARTANAELDKS